MPTIVIGGGRGLIGKRLSILLREKRYNVLHLSRKENLNAEFPAYGWDLEQGEVNIDALQQADYIINLAGAGIADKRWTPARKKHIIESRVKGNQLIANTLKEIGKKPKAIIAGAAIGYYGDRGEEELDENTAPSGKGFLSTSCIAWEESITTIKDYTERLVAIRIGIVLALQGGALPKMAQPLSFGFAPYFGNGRQWYSWIHIDDICRIFIAAIENENINGVYNGVAPQPERNRDFMRKLAAAMQKKVLLIPVYAPALRFPLGEMADTVLAGSKVSARKIVQTGFQFDYPELEIAVRNLYKK